jgi:Thermophilic metalloprotease (M29)
MKRISFLFSILILSVTISCNKKPAEKAFVLHSSELDLKAIADKTMERMDIQPGEKVFMVGMPNEFDSLIVFLSDKITAAGGSYLGTINVDTTAWPDSWNTEFVKSTNGKSKEELIKLFAIADLGIMLPGAASTHTPYAAWQEVLKSGKGRSVHLHWGGANDLKGVGIPVDNIIGLVYQSVILNTDYEKLKNIQAEFEAAIRKNGVTVTNPAGTNISFKFGDRPVTKQDGDATKARGDKGRNLIDREVELPAGAIRSAPLEETVEGVLALPTAMWGDQKVDGLVITFKKGKITDIKANEGLDFVKSKLAPGIDGYVFRELGVGFNPLLAINDLNQRILNFGYGAGIVRLALGNNSELGGKVEGDVIRITLFTDATVTTGEEVWVKDGKLVK